MAFLHYPKWIVVSCQANMNLFLDQKSQKNNEKLKAVFHKLLLEDKGAEKAKNYLSERGIDNELVETFEIGWCPICLRSKLKREREFLAGGVVFPIVSEYGDTIAFSRRLPQSDKELSSNSLKWFNDPYVKTQYLYGFNIALPNIIKNNSVIIVEGQCDVISCHKGGIKNAVGTMGPALTKEHIIKLSRLTNNFILMFDGDSSGRAATARSKELIKSLGSNKLNYLDVVMLAKGEEYDPDSFIREFGSLKLINHIRKLKKKNEQT